MSVFENSEDFILIVFINFLTIYFFTILLEIRQFKKMLERKSSVSTPNPVEFKILMVIDLKKSISTTLTLIN